MSARLSKKINFLILFFLLKIFYLRKKLSLKPNEEIINQVDNKKKHSVILSDEQFFKSSNNFYSEEPMFFNKDESMETLNIEQNGKTPGRKGFCGNFWESIKKMFGC